MDKKEFWEQTLQKLEKLEKNPVKQPVKKDYDVRRQRKIFEERQIREKLDNLVESIKEEQLLIKQLTERLNELKNEPIYKEHEKQMGALSASSRGIREHQDKQIELKKKRNAFRKVLGQYKSMAILSDEINQLEQDISRGLCKNLTEERKLIQRIKQLKKMKASVQDYEDNENQISELNKDPEYVQQQQVKTAQSVELDKIKKKKQEVDVNISAVKDSLDKAWTSLKDKYEKKNELHAQVDACSKDAKKIAIEYRQKEGEYSRYQQNLLKANEQVKRERRRKDREAKEIAERKMYQEAVESACATNDSRQDTKMQGRRQQEAAQKQNQRDNTPRRNRTGGDNNFGGGGGQEQRPNLRKKKKKDEPEKEAKESQMVDVIIPFHRELTQLRACKGYLQSFIPRPKPSTNSRPQRGKKKRRKPRGALKHNLNWLQAFSECGCSKFLVNRRENLEEAFNEISEKLDALEAKSQAAKEELEPPQKEEEAEKKDTGSTDVPEDKPEPSGSENVEKAADESVPAAN